MSGVSGRSGICRWGRVANPNTRSEGIGAVLIPEFFVPCSRLTSGKFEFALSGFRLACLESSSHSGHEIAKTPVRANIVQDSTLLLNQFNKTRVHGVLLQSQVLQTHLELGEG